MPDQVDLRAVGYDGPVKSQQMVGVCWTFALSTLMDNALRRAARQEVMAPLHILSADLWDELFRDGRSQTDLVTEPSWPYDPPKACKLNESKSEVWCDEAYHVRHGSWREDPALVQEVERAKQQGVFRIAKLEKIANPSDTRQIAAAIASGQAVYLGMNINTDVWANPNQGQLANWTAADGAHAVAAVGYRTSGGQRQFLLHNSWGTTWADGGYAWVSEAMVATKTDEAFTLEVSGPHGQPLPTTTKLPSPQQQKPAGGGFPIPLPWPFPQPGPAQPQPQPSGGVGCGAGLVRDLVFGVCVSPCASGGPPTAGICPFGAGPSGKGGQQPSPAGCAAGAVKDLVTGQCASQCPNGMPPAAGACVPWRP